MSDETKQTQTKPKQTEKKLISRRTIPYTPAQTLYALQHTYPDDFPWNGVEILEKIGGGETITVELTREMK